jgi:hypothetical protein
MKQIKAAQLVKQAEAEAKQTATPSNPGQTGIDR